METPSGVASRWRWVVLASSTISLMLCGYGQYHVGVLKVLLLRHTDNDVTVVTWMASYYTGGFSLTAPVASLLVSTVNCRASGVLSGLLCLVGFVLSSLVTDVTHLFLTLTIVSVGQSMSQISALVVLGYYFPGRAALVTGVSVAGGALGIFLHPPLLQALSERYGLSGAMLLAGAVAFQGSVCGALMRPTGLEKKVTESKNQGSNAVQRLCHVASDACSGHARLLTSWRLVAFLAASLFFSLAYHGLVVQLPHYLIQRSGLTPTQASFSISVCGLGSLVSRLASGLLAHDAAVGSLLVFAGLNGVQALTSMAAPALLQGGIVGSYVYCLTLGLYSGGCFTLFFPVVLEVVGVDQSSTATGIVYCFVGIGAMIGAPFLELAYQGDQSPYVLFGFIGAMFLVSALFAGLVTVLPSPALLQTSAAQGKPILDSSQSLQQTQQVPEQETLLSALETKTETEKIPEQETRLSASKSTQQTQKVLEQKTLLSDLEVKTETETGHGDV